MTNKLLEIKQKWIKENEDYLLGWGLSMKIIESIGDDIVNNAVEYARSIIPSNYYCGESYDYGEGFEHGSNQTIELIKTRIDQDLQSLKEK